MTNDYINISAIETHLDKVIRKYITKSCYAGTLPPTLSDKVKSYVVIESVNALHDFAAYGQGIVNIYLYAQPINGMKNVAELSRLETAFNKALQEDAFDYEHYRVAREVAYTNSNYDTTYNMHFIIKAIRLTII